MKTLNEIRIQGFNILVRNLGPADAIRFIQSYSHGSGDYTKERKAWLPKDFDTVVTGIIEHRERKTGIQPRLRVPRHKNKPEL